MVLGSGALFGPEGESWIPGITQAEAIGAFKFVAQLRGLEIFAYVGDALLERVEGTRDGLGIGVRDVAPHGKRAGPETGHLPQSAAADGEEISVGRKFIFEERAHRGGDELREMADPGAEDVVADGIEIDDAGAEAGDPGAPGLGGRRLRGGANCLRPDSME